MTRLGFEVEHAADGLSGLECLARSAFDVVALDHYMPGMSGEETLAAILDLPAAPPVVYVTASDECEVAVTALKSGASDYMIKDAGRDFFDLLAAILRQTIESARLRRAEEAARAEVELARERAELLLMEVNHRVANSLTLVVSMAHLQAGALPAGPAREAMEDFANRVYAIAQVHKRLYTSHDIRTVALGGYLGELIRDLYKSMAGNKALTGIDIECADIEVSIDRAISLGVILSELITNAGKYAYPDGRSGAIRVFCRDEGSGRAALVVEDDGVGLGQGGQSGTGLGTQMIEALAQGLQGRLEWEAAAKGTRVVLEFPVDFEAA